MVTLTTWRRALICSSIPEDSNSDLAPDKPTTPLQLHQQPSHHNNNNNNLIHSPSKFITTFFSSSSSSSSSLLPRNNNQLHHHHSSCISHHAPMQDHPLRCYNDDEPLMSPVLESDEEILTDNNNMITTAITVVSTNSRDDFVVSVSSSFTHFDNTRVALLSIRAPLGSLRACMDVVAVLDVGGDMTARKLHALKRAMWLFISSLSSNDRLSIVAFSSGSKRLLPLRRMTPSGKRTARRITDALNLGQGSRVNDALKKAIKVLHDRKESNQSSTIILMNGQDHGVQSNHSRRFRHVSSTRVLDIPVHTLRVTEELEENIFGKLVKRLLNVVVLDFRFKLELSTSSTSPVEIGAVYSFLEGPTSLNPDVAKLGDFYSKEERQIMVEIKTPPVTSSSSSSSYHDDVILTVRSSYVDPSAKHVMNTCENTVTVGYPTGDGSDQDQRLRSVYVMTKAVAESRRLVTECSDYSGAERVLYNAREVLCKLNNNCSDEFRRRVEVELAEVILRRRQKRKRVKEFVDGRWRVVDDAPPVSAWKVAERLAKLAVIKTSLNRVGDLHGFEDARF